MKPYHTTIQIPIIFQKALKIGLKIPLWQRPEMNPYNGFNHAQRVRKWQALLLAIEMGIIPKPTGSECDICGANHADAELQYHSEDCLIMRGHYPLCKTCHRILHQRYLLPGEWNNLIKSELRSGKWFTLLSSESKPKIMKKVCRICARNLPGCKEFLYNNELFTICVDCNKYFFASRCKAEIKDILDKAIDIVVEKHVYLKYALNVVEGRYVLKEAIRKTALASKESSGESVDIFSRGKRLSGNYKSKM